MAQDKPLNNPNSKVNLIRTFYSCTLQEMKALTSSDRDQLASGIARDKGLTPEVCGFEFAQY